MTHRVLLSASVACLLLAACQAEPSSRAESVSADAAPTEMASVAAPGEGGRAAASSTEIPDAQRPQLAYSYRYTLETPAREVSSLAERHEQACVAAGPAVCQVIGANLTRQGDDDSTATLELRATPQWLRTFRAGLADDAEAAHGRIAEQATETEDLTRQLVDTEAHLAAKRALRDRIQAMMATRAGDLQTALQVEQELARVQAEIDSAESQLAVMRARVEMSRLTLTYQSRGVVAPDSAFSPVRSAMESALGVFMFGIAAIVWFVAFAAPFALIIGPIVWFVLRRRRKAKASPPPPAT